MTAVYLGTSWLGDDEVEIHLTTDPLNVLRLRGGRVSPLYALGPVPEELPQQLAPRDGSVAILFPRSSRDTLSTVSRRAPLDLASKCYFTHGLGSVVIIADGDDERARLESLVQSLRPGLLASEWWPVVGGRVRPSTVSIWSAPLAGPTVAPFELDATGLPDYVRAEVRELNLNLAMFNTVAASYAPELLEMTSSVARNIHGHLEESKSRLSDARHGRMPEADAHASATLLVDLNSSLTMALSQLGAVTPPVINSTFAVGSYSLLGVGSAYRALWRIYAHAAEVFEKLDLVGHLLQGRGVAGFVTLGDALADSASITATRDRAFANYVKPAAPPRRRHIVCFSSRWGFHETLNAMTASWQSLGAGAHGEWNLLTLSHEYFHGLLRDIIKKVVFEAQTDAEASAIAAKFDESRVQAEGPVTLQQALQCFLLSQAARAEEVNDLVVSLPDPGKGALDIATLRHLVTGPLTTYVEEYLVHILDYHYFYNSDNDAYVRSIWKSWSTVPAVRLRVRHYVCRTLLALASEAAPTTDVAAFTLAHAKFRASLTALGIDETTPDSLPTLALAVLDSQEELNRVWHLFSANFGLVPFARGLLLDETAYERLTYDGMSVATDGVAYPYAVGEFPEEPVESPTKFLLDRFSAEDPRDTNGRESLWQLLSLI